MRHLTKLYRVIGRKTPETRHFKYRKTRVVCIHLAQANAHRELRYVSTFQQQLKMEAARENSIEKRFQKNKKEHEAFSGLNCHFDAKEYIVKINYKNVKNSLKEW